MEPLKFLQMLKVLYGTINFFFIFGRFFMEPLKVLQMLKVLYGTIKGSSDVEGSLWNY